LAGKIKKLLKKFTIKRTTILLALFFIMCFVLVQKLFKLQIIEGDTYVTNFESQTKKTRTVKSTRGDIYDRNGNVLASNILSYSLTLEDNGSYDNTRQKNLTLNSVAYKIIQILTANGDEVDHSFHVKLDENDNYIYDLEEGFNLDRFRADIYGYAMIDEFKEKKPEQAKATAQEMMDYLVGEERFSILLKGENSYTKEELDAYQLPESFTPSELLDIAIIRYALSTNSFKKYVPVTIATDVSNETVAAIMENKSELQGIDVVEDSIRSYEDGLYFSSIIGYTGKASAEELEELRKKDSSYASDAIVGKTGIEQYMELELQGHDGEETVYVDKLGKVLKIDEDTKVAPVAGNDVHLTIDKDWQEALYHILEQRVAGILIANIEYAKTFDYDSISDRSQIRIPIYDVFNALVKNSILDINHFGETDASDTEKNLYAKFQQKQQEIFDRIKEELTGAAPKAYKDLDEEMQEYLDYIVKELLMDKLEILSSDAIDKTDTTYLDYTKDGSISLQQYLTYAASMNWIDISSIAPEGDYLDSTEVYRALADYLADYLTTDTAFSKLLYQYMLLSDTISGQELCLALYDQGILEQKEGDDTYERLANGSLAASDFMISKISTLEITPGQLALSPCSASAVLTDVKTGDTLACVTYPGYDNNRLANNMDADYYNKLVNDLAQPFYNKATQQRTAPGSTFKLASAIAGYEEGVIDINTGIECTGSFDLVNPHINCWNKSGHGVLELESAIEQSCNVYFNTIGFMMGKDAEGNFSESLSLQKLKNYASILGLDKKSGLEITESSPRVSDEFAVPSYMGQGTNLYTTSQLARYVTMLANSGTVFNLTLLDKVTDSQNNILQDYSAEIENQVELPTELWNTIHNGMQRVVATHAQFDNVGVDVAGKTGTAEEAEDKPSHGMFVGYAPFEDPQYALAVRIPYGYSSGNACLLAKDIFSYVFNTKDKDKIVTGMAASDTSNTSND
jgi:penicillin-binding protein 2